MWEGGSNLPTVSDFVVKQKKKKNFSVLKKKKKKVATQEIVTMF